MALKPNPDNFPKGEKDPGYKSEVAGMDQNPEGWNRTAPGGVPTIMTPNAKSNPTKEFKELEKKFDSVNSELGGKAKEVDELQDQLNSEKKRGDELQTQLDSEKTASSNDGGNKK